MAASGSLYIVHGRMAINN